MNLVGSMLANKQVIKRFWAKALANTLYLRNLVTSRALPPNSTPYYKWMGNAPTLNHVRVFGSECWYTLPKKKVQKLDNRARGTMFLGYAESSNAYKLWDGEL